MFKNEMGFMNEIKKVLGFEHCIIQKYFIDRGSAREYFEECCENYDDKDYDVYIQHSLGYDRYQVVVLKRRGA